MVKKLKDYAKALTNVFYIVFPILFAKCIYHSVPIDKELTFTHLQNYSHIHINHQRHREICSFKAEKNDSHNYVILLIEKFPLMLFKILIVIFLVAMWKLNYLEKLLKTGVF